MCVLGGVGVCVCAGGGVSPLQHPVSALTQIVGYVGNCMAEDPEASRQLTDLPASPVYLCIES